MNKHNVFRYLHLSLLSLILVSCDPVSVDDRYIEMDKVEAKRTVLLEEFTGQNCVNCPTAHRAIEALQELYGPSLISVSIHAGQSAYPEGMLEPIFQTFKTPEGDDYAAMWGITAYPSGVVNRSTGVLTWDKWAASIREKMSEPTPLELTAEAHYEDGKIVAGVSMISSEDVKGKLQLWVVEDSLVSLQVDGGVTLTDYVHNNVYRASLNGVGGDDVALQKNVYANSTLDIEKRDYWQTAHLSIVAFVYNDKEVLQATKVPVTIEENK